jgi:hypothetical protein
VYNANASEVDEFMWNQRDMLVLFAAGNSGVYADGSGIIDPDSIGSPGTTGTSWRLVGCVMPEFGRESAAGAARAQRTCRVGSFHPGASHGVDRPGV